MLKRLLTSALTFMVLVLGVQSTWGQQLYLSFDAGYGTPVGSQKQILEHVTYTENGFNKENIDFSLGQGMQFGGSLGYMFNEKIGLEAEISYLVSQTVTARWTHEDWNSTTALSARMLNFSPNIVVSTGTDEDISLYAKFGAVIGRGKITSVENEVYRGDSIYIKKELSGGLAIGMNAGLGVNFLLSDQVSFFGEIYSRNMSYSPKRGEVTGMLWNGEEQHTDGLEICDREIIFVDEIAHTYEGERDNSQPTEALSQKYPFGNLGLKIGLRIGF